MQVDGKTGRKDKLLADYQASLGGMATNNNMQLTIIALDYTFIVRE